MNEHKTESTTMREPINTSRLKVGILGLGEIGSAVQQLNEKHGIAPEASDLKMGVNTLTHGLDILNVCIPWSAYFEEAVMSAYHKYQPTLIIIHSTIPVGITQKLNGNLIKGSATEIVHSPVRGVHPKLVEGLEEFVKYIGADSAIAGDRAAFYLHDVLGLKVKQLSSSRASELGKLLDTTYYGLCIAYHDYANSVCEACDVPFEEAMTEFNNSYNYGYPRLGKANVVRPVLYAPEDRKIGGHCVIPNADILTKQFGEDEILNSILRHR